MLLESESGSSALLETLLQVSVARYCVPLRRPIPGNNGPLLRRGHLLIFEYDGGATVLGEASPLPGFSMESSADVEEALIVLADTLVDGRKQAAMLPAVDFAYQSVVRTVQLRNRILASTIRHGLVEEPRQVQLNGLVEANAAGVPVFIECVRRGFETMKVKVGNDSIEGEAAVLVKMASEAKHVRLRLDANRRWSLPRALSFADVLRTSLKKSGLSDSSIEYFEEPVLDALDTEAFATESGFRVALDETIREYADWTTVVDPSYVAALVVKPMLTGLSAAEAVVTTARGFAIPSVVSSAFETGIGLYANMAFALEWAGETVAGLGTFDWIENDLVAPRMNLFRPRVELYSSVKETQRLNLDLVEVVHSVKM